MLQQPVVYAASGDKNVELRLAPKALLSLLPQEMTFVYDISE